MRPVILVLVGAWIAGIIMGVMMGGVVWPMLLALIFLMGTFWQKQSLPMAAAVGVLSLLGGVYGASSISRTALACPIEGEVTGFILARPDIRENSVRYLVEDKRGCLFFVYADRWPVFERGSEVAVVGGRYTDQAGAAADNPGFGQYLVRQGVAGVWSYPRLTPLTVAADPAYRDLVDRAHTIFVEPDASLVGALLLADRGQLPAETIENFRRTSLTHILSISGTHISLLTAMLFGLVALLPLSPPVRTTLVVALLWGYVWFVGAPVTAVRAGFFWSVTLVALRLGLLVSLPTAIILTLTLMLTWQPRLSADIGLQLSFLAVVGIFLALFISRPWRKRIPLFWHGLFSAVLVSLGATVFTWPLISYYFGLVSLSAVGANLLILPSVPVIMAGSVLAIGTSYVSALLSYIVAWPVHLAVVWMIAVAELLGQLAWTWVELTVPLRFVVGYYLALVAGLIALLRWQGRSWREVWE